MNALEHAISKICLKSAYIPISPKVTSGNNKIKQKGRANNNAIRFYVSWRGGDEWWAGVLK